MSTWDDNAAAVAITLHRVGEFANSHDWEEALRSLQSAQEQFRWLRIRKADRQRLRKRLTEACRKIGTELIAYADGLQEGDHEG